MEMRRIRLLKNKEEKEGGFNINSINYQRNSENTSFIASDVFGVSLGLFCTASHCQGTQGSVISFSMNKSWRFQITYSVEDRDLRVHLPKNPFSLVQLISVI